MLKWARGHGRQCLLTVAVFYFFVCIVFVSRRDFQDRTGIHDGRWDLVGYPAIRPQSRRLLLITQPQWKFYTSCRQISTDQKRIGRNLGLEEIRTAHDHSPASMVGSSACRWAVVRTTWHTNPHKINIQKLAIFPLCNEIKKQRGSLNATVNEKSMEWMYCRTTNRRTRAYEFTLCQTEKRGSQRRGKAQFKVIAKIVCKSKMPSGKNGQTWSSAIPRPSGCHLYEGHSEIIDTLPPFSNEDERFIHQPEIQWFYFVPCGGWILLWTVWTKTGSKEEPQSLQGTSTSPSHHEYLPFESKLPFPVCFLSILRKGESSRWIDDQVKVGEKRVENR